MLKGVVETTPADPISSYFNELGRALTAVRVSDAEGLPLDIEKGFEWVAETARNAHNSGNKVSAENAAEASVSGIRGGAV